MGPVIQTSDTSRRRRPGPVASYLLAALGLYAFQYAWHVVVGERPLTIDHPPPGWYLSGWLQFDAGWYQDIVVHGYSFHPTTPSNVAFFPLYPLLMRGLGVLGIDGPTAGVAIAIAAGAAAAAGWDRWLRDVARPTSTARRTAFWLLLLFPFSFFLLGPAYADTLLLAATFAAFLLAERGRPVAAGLAAAVATAARPTGIAVVVGIAVLELVRTGVLRPTPRRGRWSIDRTALGPTLLAPLLGLLGIGAYSVYLWARFGDPLAYVTTQSAFHAGTRPLFDLNVLEAARKGWAAASPATLVVGGLVLALAVGLAVRLGRSRPPIVRVAILAFALGALGVVGRWRDFAVDPVYRATITVQAFVCLGVALCIPAVHRRFGPAYSSYVTAIVAATVLTNGNLQSAGRYMVGAFPVAVLAAERLADRPALRRGTLAVSGTAMVLLAVAHSFVYFIA